MPQNLIERIAQRYAVGLADEHEVRAGDFVAVRPAHVMTHDNTAAVIPKFKSMGATKIADPKQPVFALDHDIQNASPENLAKYARIEAFASKHGVAFFPAGRGIGHQIMVEEGFVLPGTFVVASDSHSNLYGALGALGTPVVRTDAAAIWATGQTWWQVPDTVRVNLLGGLQAGVSGKDVIISLIGVFDRDEVLNCGLEFSGPGVSSLGIEERLTIANMTTEWGALAGVFPYDETTRDYLLSRAALFRERGDSNPRLTVETIERMESGLPRADADAVYAKELDLDLSVVTPFVAGPNEVKVITPLPEMEERNVRIHKAFLMSCVNARLQDFEAAAKVIQGKHVHEGVKLYVAAASGEIEQRAKERGYWQALIEAGAVALPSGCGACIGLGEGVLGDGEVGISATNRNFKGRMGSRDSFVYLSSPAVVAASAIAGRIAGPARVDVSIPHKLPTTCDASAKTAPEGATSARAEARLSARQAGGSVLSDLPGASHETPSAGSDVPGNTARAEARGSVLSDLLKRGSACRVHPRAAVPKTSVEILPGFPESIEGELLFVPKDNMNTDGIYGKEFTYQDNLTAQEMGSKAMLNYDPRFQGIAKEGDILIGGYNFGSGSSREQAATALKHRGLQMIIAGSFSQTYKRNAFNNGYIVIECPELVDRLRHAHADNDALTIRTGSRARVDFTRARIECEKKTYAFAPPGPVVQELVVRGGLEPLISKQMRSRMRKHSGK